MVLLIVTTSWVQVSISLAVQDTVLVNSSVLQGTPAISIKSMETESVDLTSMAFGAVPNTSTDHRTKQVSPAGGAWVECFSGGGKFELRVWYDNYPDTSTDTHTDTDTGISGDPTKPLAGLKYVRYNYPPGDTDTYTSTDTDTDIFYWPHKVWCPNFGYRSGLTPVPESDQVEGGPNPDDIIPDTYPKVELRGKEYWGVTYAWILERVYKVDGFGNTGLPVGYPPGTYRTDTRTRLCWYYPTGTPIRPGSALDARLPSRFRVDLGIDALDAQYAGTTAIAYFGVLTFDLTQAP